MKEELVSIIVPVYNAEKYIEFTINSVIEQSYNNWELLLIDDCSVDNSKSIIENYSKKDVRIKYYKQKKNSGPAVARNRGIDLAKGRYVCFIDADDLWEKDKIKRQLEFMKIKECAFCYHSYVFANEEGIPTEKKVIAKEKLTYKDALKNNIISTITVMFDLKKIDKELIKMPNLKYVEDTATWWKILRNGYVAYGIGDLFSISRRIPNSTSSNKLKTQKYLWNLYRKEEKLSILSSIYYLSIKNINAILRRI